MTNLNDSEFISKLNNHLKSGGVIDGHCLATTSANISGQSTLTSADEIRKTFPNIIVIDNATAPMGGAPSTVAILDGDNINIVRAGGVVIE